MEDYLEYGVYLMRKKQIVRTIVGILVVIFALAFGVWIGKKLEKTDTDQTIHLLIVGDSISEGAGASDPSLKWYKYLIPYMKDKYGKNLQITNVSMGGNTSYAGFVRVMQLEQKEDYDLVMICFGENDAEENFAENYEKLLQTIVGKWPSSKLITILESSQREYTPKIQTIQRLGEQYHVYVMDTISAFDQSGKKYEELCDDGTHPNDEGQKVYYSEAVKVIDQIYGQSLENYSAYLYYSMKDFSQGDDLSLKLRIDRKVDTIGIDYDRIPGHQEIEISIDEEQIWNYRNDWNYTFTQRHIEKIEKLSQQIEEIRITFSSKEQMDAFHGVIIE